MKILTQFILSLIGSILFGIIGLWLGATIGGNFGFPPFGGIQGYESGGIFFSIVGISLGSFLFTQIIKKRRKEEFEIKIAIITSLAVACAGIIIFDTNMQRVVGLIILLMQSVVLTFISNWPWFLKAGIKKQLVVILAFLLVIIFSKYFINQKKQKILELNYKPTEEFCSSLSTNFYKDECLDNFDKCIPCKETTTSTYFTCHSRKFCEDKFKGELVE